MLNIARFHNNLTQTITTVGVSHFHVSKRIFVCFKFRSVIFYITAYGYVKSTGNSYMIDGHYLLISRVLRGSGIQFQQHYLTADRV